VRLRKGLVKASGGFGLNEVRNRFFPTAKETHFLELARIGWTKGAQGTESFCRIDLIEYQSLDETNTPAFRDSRQGKAQQAHLARDAMQLPGSPR